MGKWVYRDKDNHKCEKPPGAYDVKAGDIWECSCGKLWVVNSIQRKGDQRDSYWDVQVNEFHGPVPEQRTGYAVNKLPRDSVLGGYRDR